jgi:hypothetical protein
MIVDKNGTINIENLGFLITPEFLVNDLHRPLNYLVNDLHRPLNDKHIIHRGSNSGFDRYTIRDMLIDGLPFGGLFIFYNYKIATVLMSYIGFKSKIPDEITQEQEDLTKKKHDEIMMKQYGTSEVKYKWGSISSIKGRDGEALIIITYNNFPIKGRQ